MDGPLLSICIPTYNRAELLDYCLENVRPFERFDIPFEVVVSDNASTDQTAAVLRKHGQALRCLRPHVQSKTVPGGQNYGNALRHARGELFFFLADDDSLLLEPLAGYVQRMQREPDLVAIYSDWIAYDDAQGRELHRYFRFTQPACFGPDNPIGLLNFTLQQVLLPEIGVFRRNAFLQAEYQATRGLYAHFHLLYRLSRLGRIAFELTPYYREHRVLKPQFASRSCANMGARLQYIGDEFRNHLETVALWTFQDAGVGPLAEEQKRVVSALIDRYLASRIPLEIARCVAERDWLLAADLRRRMVLWYGAGPPEEQHRDTSSIVLPAALQAVHNIYCGLCDVSGLLLCGFRTRQVHGFFREHYPQVNLLEPDAAPPGGTSRGPLVLYRDAAAAAESKIVLPGPGYALRLDHLLENYRIHALKPDLGDL
jgi:hypothetical protein